MTVGDIVAVAAIEASSLSPWNREQIAFELQREIGISLVAVAPGGGIVAWCCGFQAGRDAELLKITVTPEWQRLRVGETLLQQLCLLFAEQGVQQIFLEVRSQNCPALKLYVKLGWQKTGRRNNYYKEPADDAVVFVRRLNNFNTGNER
jgi:[ribosomal protein S18]-alanine N-acetyltransferase